MWLAASEFGGRQEKHVSGCRAPAGPGASVSTSTPRRFLSAVTRESPGRHRLLPARGSWVAAGRSTGRQSPGEAPGAPAEPEPPALLARSRCSHGAGQATDQPAQTGTQAGQLLKARPPAGRARRLPPTRGLAKTPAAPPVTGP